MPTEPIHLQPVSLAAHLPSTTPAFLAAAVAGLCLATLVIWSALTEVETVITVPVVARPASGTVELRAPLPGRVARIAAPEGSELAAGQLTIALDATLARDRLEAAADALANRLQRLAEQRAVLALTRGRPAAVAVPESARLQVEAQRGRLARLDDEIRALESELQSTRQRVGASRDLLKVERERYAAMEQALDAGALSRFEWLRARRALDLQASEATALQGQAVVLESRLAASRHSRTAEQADYHQSLLASIAALELDVTQLEAQRAEALEQLRLTRIVTPRAGTIDRLLVTPGDFVERGDVVAVVVPVNAAVYFEARVAPRHTAFLEPGQRCRIKLDALPFARYGALGCTVKSLSRDVVPDDGGGYYLARVRPAAQMLRAGGIAVPLRPGATGWVDIVAGERTVLGFVTEPLRRFADESLREL